MSEITIIDTEFGEFHTCNNCGASAPTPEEIKHHPTCTPGESKKWQDFYEKAYEEEYADDKEVIT